MGNTVAFLCLPGLDSFSKTVIRGLQENYAGEFNIVECVSSDGAAFQQAIARADVVWIEWANELAIELTRNPQVLQGRKVIVRCHAYEIVDGYIERVNWEPVSKVIFVSSGIAGYAARKVPKLATRTVIIPNGIDLEKFRNERGDTRPPGKNVGLLALLNHKKGLQLLLHAFHHLASKYKGYKLHLGGPWMDESERLYFEHMAQKLGLSENIVQHGKVEAAADWWQRMDYVVCTSPRESHGVGLCEAMACGVKPVIHWFPWAETIYPEKYLWLTVEQFAQQIRSESNYNPAEYRSYVAERFDLNRTSGLIRELLQGELACKGFA